ncbi:hypothetical protein BLNAU_25100 [Blattamonas nauphoetae]|uniref:Uncharacterized protein n=1 Tax=Blattamonas nauphoetae TaxID=2049346 RepID=A0ABQ9WKJ5_9EUKA|nr:hypothetical protein BLNAU_25100 [Blattamonas nauphoetae]
MVGTNKSKRFGAHRNITRLDFVGFASFSTLDTTSLTTLGCPRLTLPTILPPLYHRLPLSSAANHRLFTFRFSLHLASSTLIRTSLLLLPNTNTHHNLGIWIEMKERDTRRSSDSLGSTRGSSIVLKKKEERHLAWLNKKAPFVCPPHTTSSLFTVSDEASLFVMEESKMAFADHSGFEFDGGSVKLLLARDLNSVLIANVATTGDGASETRGGDYFIPRSIKIAISTFNRL